MNTTKTYGAGGNNYGHTDQDGIERFWRHLLAGAASIRFHRPDAGLGLSDKAVAAIRAARKLEAKIPLWSVQAANELLSDRTANEAYLAAAAGSAYALYFPAGGEVRVDLTAAGGPLVAHWINIDSGEWGASRAYCRRRENPAGPAGTGQLGGRHHHGRISRIEGSYLQPEAVNFPYRLSSDRISAAMISFKDGCMPIRQSFP